MYVGTLSYVSHVSVRQQCMLVLSLMFHMLVSNSNVCWYSLLCFTCKCHTAMYVGTLSYVSHVSVRQQCMLVLSLMFHM